jgi:3-oxoacyl-[acyl-carrier protein] reductase
MSAIAVKADISKGDEISKLIEASEAIGGIDTLVLNAGVASYGLFQDVSEQEYDRVMDTNVKGAFLVAKAFVPKMVSKKSGSIVTLSSMWGEVGGSCETVYSMSKAALIGMTKALAKELGPSGIRVNCIAPGVIDTEMNAALQEEDRRALIEETPLMRLGTPADVAAAALFLAGEGASFITGQVLGVNGGFVI